MKSRPFLSPALNVIASLTITLVIALSVTVTLNAASPGSGALPYAESPEFRILTRKV